MKEAAEAVGEALHQALAEEGEPVFADLEPDERAGIVSMAEVAMQAHLEWLDENGFRIAPPGTMLRPKTENDARAMILAGQQFLAEGKGRSSSKRKLITGPGLIVPPGTTRQ